jgi:hypothetical protein
MDLFTPFSRHQPLSSPGDCRYRQNTHAGTEKQQQQQEFYSVDGPTTRTLYTFLITALDFTYF